LMRPNEAAGVTLPESTSNIEFAHRLHEHDHELHHGHAADPRHEWVALAEAIVLAVVAIATAWSGYQAAKWDALSAEQYALHGQSIILSQEKTTIAGQYRLYDVTTFNAWMGAKTSGNKALMKFFERRFRPEYRTAFDDWLKLDPMNNEKAPPGPGMMPSFHDPYAAEAADISKQAHAYFEKAVSSRETGDQYVKVTVLLATVLLLTALSQRFKVLSPRVIVVVVAFVLLISATVLIFRLPRI
jgi:hypothetical protein